MNITELRELTDADLDIVSGGADYKFCWDGPAGTGTYPSYVDCADGKGSYGLDDLASDVAGAIISVIRGLF